MYKDFKKSETLDTGFTSGSSLLWMFSGIVLGLLVGMGMYFVSNDKIPKVSMIDSLEKKIQKVQTTKSTKPASTLQQNSNQDQLGKTQTEKKAEEKQRRNKFSYYAVLPNLDVPVGSAKPINTSTDSNNTIATSEAQAAVEQEIETVEKIPEEPEAVAEVGDYMLQVASFKKQSMANKTRGRLTKRGIDAYVQKKKIKGRYWYRVVAGPVDQTSIDNWKYTAEKLGHKPLVISLR